MGVFNSTILIVDDDANVLRLLDTALKSFGWHSVRTAINGAQALEMVAQSLPDLVITDVVMPEVDGHELVRKLRNTPETANIPVLMLGAQDRAGQDSRTDGADEYLSKPFSLVLLKQKVEEILNSQATRKGY